MQLARDHIHFRRKLAARLPAKLFADPALEILLDLFIAEGTSRQISVSSACIASGVSGSTASAWIKRLEKAGLVTRRRDEADGRRTFLQLEDDASTAIATWLEETSR